MAGGRPTKYKKEYEEQAYKFCLLGATNERLAEMLDVGITTIDRWIADKPEFRGAIRKGKDVADAEIAQSLFHRAKGYSHVDTKFATHEGKVTDTVEYTKHYPPDTAAAFIWLKNRADWTDKSIKELTGADGGPIEYTKLSEDELEARIAELKEE